MATAEAIFRGAPGEFESAVRAHDRQLGERHGIPAGAMLIYKTAWPPAAPSAAEAAVVISDLPLAEAASRGGSWDSHWPIIPWQWKSTITAHSLPGGRSLLRLSCQEAIWPIVEEHWQALLAELIRLGYIASAEPEPHPEPVAPKPKRKPPGRRHSYSKTDRRKMCETWRSIEAQGTMSQEAYAEEYCRRSVRTLGYWLAEFGL